MFASLLRLSTARGRIRAAGRPLGLFGGTPLLNRIQPIGKLRASDGGTLSRHRERDIGEGTKAHLPSPLVAFPREGPAL
ncbi:hypothetical protein J2X47_003499 [Sphingomonas sp. BE270]|nr:hypothetical protein [Sphingomonas sp. BE270]MDR7259300.1 hypothetical protein [Sphingomonas sp. BE270]